MIQWLMMCNKRAYPCRCFVQYARKRKENGMNIVKPQFAWQRCLCKDEISPACSQRIIPFDNYTDTPFIFYGMLIVFTGGHGGMFAGYRHSYTRHVLGFFLRWLCPPVTAHRPAGSLISVALPEKELPAGEQCSHSQNACHQTTSSNAKYKIEKSQRSGSAA